MWRARGESRSGSRACRAGLAAALASLLVVTGCDDPLPTAPSAGPVTLAGRVTDYLTGVPVAGELVTFSSFTAGATASARTDTVGRYVLTLPQAGEYEAYMHEVFIGRLYVGDPRVGGDLLRGTGTCIARYGFIVDSVSLRPIPNVRLELGNLATTTGVDGSYRFDLGCPDEVLPGGTTVMSLTHPDYQTRGQGVGRGVAFVSRLDVTMERKR